MAITTQTNYINKDFYNPNGIDLGENAKNWLTRDRFYGIYPSLTNGINRSGIYTVGARTENGMLFGNGFSGITIADDISYDTPVAAKVKPGGWKTVSCSARTAAAIDKDQRLYIWGFNNWGQLGLGDYVARSFPTQVNISGEVDTKWSQVVCAQDYNETASYQGSCTFAIKADDGKLYSWGYNDKFRLGFGLGGTNETRPTPVPVKCTFRIKYVTVGQWSVLAIREDGRLLSWGQYADLQSGNNQNGAGDAMTSTTNRSSPVLLTSDAKWKSVSCTYKTALAINEVGDELFSWGSNSYGQMGVNLSDINLSSFNSPIPTLPGSGKRWRAVSTGWYHCAAIDSEGDLYTWGFNGYGQLGHNDQITRSSPTLVVCEKKWFRVSCDKITTWLISTSGELFLMGGAAKGGLLERNFLTPTMHYTQGSGRWVALSESGDYSNLAIVSNPVLDEFYD